MSCINFSKRNKGRILGLVVYGPKSDADIAAPAPILLHTVHCTTGGWKEKGGGGKEGGAPLIRAESRGWDGWDGREDYAAAGVFRWKAMNL